MNSFETNNDKIRVEESREEKLQRAKKILFV